MTFVKPKRSIGRDALNLLGLWLLVVPITGWGQGGVAPTYISTLADYEVRSLSGSYAPTNGTSSMESITPAEWVQNDYLPGVITKWSGGAKGMGTKLFVHGGGHNGSANNGLYVFDFSGTNAPTGWESPLVISSYSAVCNACNTYTDGGPTSVHTYDGMVYTHHNNHVYRFGGAWFASSGGWTRASFKYDVATRRWTQIAPYPYDVGRSTVTFYDPDTRKIYVKAVATASGYFLRTDSDTWSGDRPIDGNRAGYYVVAAWDTRRKRGIMVGEGNNFLVDIDFVNETVSASPLSASGSASILNVPAPSVVYDPTADVYWMYGGRTLNYSGSNYDTIYRMNADGPPWVITAHQLTGDTVQYSDIMHGPYGRFVLMDQWRALGMVQSHNSPVYVIKLPGTVTNIVASEPPSNLSVQ